MSAHTSAALLATLATLLLAAAQPVRKGFCDAAPCFSGALTNAAVLQRAPQRAVLFGSAGYNTTAGAPLAIELSGALAGGAPFAKNFSTLVRADGSWRVALDAMPAGGDFVARILCPSCAPKADAWHSRLVNLTFGDVWVCGGQSNMALGMSHAFVRNATYWAIASGAYDHIRVRNGQNDGNGNADCTADADTFVCPGEGPNDSCGMVNGQLGRFCPLAQLVVNGSGDPGYGPGMQNKLDLFSATCLYFGVQLTDLLREAGEEAPPIGLVDTSAGGTQVEHWTPLAVQMGDACANWTCSCSWPNPGWTGCPLWLHPLNPVNCSENARRWNAIMPSLLNVTVRGVLWYQGENNLQFDPGSSLHKRGYGCALPAMVAAWRAGFAANGENDPLLPFGIMQLHDGSAEGEGFPGRLAGFRSAQTANFGSLPNEYIPNSVGLTMVDAGDPWDGGEQCARDSCCVTPDYPLGPLCVGDHREHGGWSNETPDGGGSLHPRTKDIGGRRFAQAVFATWYAPASPLLATGPVFTGCRVDAGARTLTLIFDAARLKGERVIVAKPPGAAPLALAMENTALYVLSNSTLDMEALELNYNPCNYALGSGGDCENATYLGPYSAGNELGARPWTAVMPAPGAAANEVVVDLTPLGGALPTAVRYATGAGESAAWANGTRGFGVQRICCGPYVDTAHEPCPPESCPLKSSALAGAGGLQLPALSFFAAIDAQGRCVCVPPQVCDTY